MRSIKMLCVQERCLQRTSRLPLCSKVLHNAAEFQLSMSGVDGGYKKSNNY
jgi:hypothetical protein